MLLINRWILVGLLAIVGCFIENSQTCFAENATSVLETKNKLKRLNDQINQLKKTLSHVQDKRGVLNQELANTEKQIGVCIQKISGIQDGITVKQKNIVLLQQQVNTLNSELENQQDLLAQHLKARYQMGEYRPLIIALNQNDLYKINRLLTFYQYLVRSRQNIIDDIIQTQKKIAVKQNNLQQEIKSQQTLRTQLYEQRQNFEHTKSYHQVVIKSLNQDIQNQQHTLSEYEQDKANLSRLLLMLARDHENITHPTQAFSLMKHKLPFPVKVPRQAMQRMNQGVTFFAREGMPVFSVYPGRVVFSDWLRGYGLLLIIDHGQGCMTLYAHNQALFKYKGAQVAQGEQIATIGHSGGLKQNGLYFEVRLRGKAVSPLEWFS